MEPPQDTGEREVPLHGGGGEAHSRNLVNEDPAGISNTFMMGKLWYYRSSA